jgi:hypothetical protein
MANTIGTLSLLFSGSNTKGIPGLFFSPANQEPLAKNVCYCVNLLMAWQSGLEQRKQVKVGFTE